MIAFAGLILGCSCSASDESGLAASSANTSTWENQDFLDFFWSGGEDDDAAIQAEIDSLIAECMRVQGFDLPIELPSVGTTAARQASVPAEGYGALELLRNDRSVEPRLVTWTDRAEPFVQAFSPVERARFGEALWGDGSALGCEEFAAQEAQTHMNRFDASFSDILDGYYARLKTDPTMRRSNAVWKACVEKRTGVSASTSSTMPLSRENIGLAVSADLAVRLGRSVRWLTLAEADNLDLSAIDPPHSLVIDGETEIGPLIFGPTERLSTAVLTSAEEREAEIWEADQECWRLTDGPERTAELQGAAMEEVAILQAAEPDVVQSPGLRQSRG